MTTRPEKSDDRTSPEGRRKAVPTSTNSRGGRAITAVKATRPLPLFSETADLPRGPFLSGGHRRCSATASGPCLERAKRGPGVERHVDTFEPPRSHARVVLHP